MLVADSARGPMMLSKEQLAGDANLRFGAWRKTG